MFCLGHPLGTQWEGPLLEGTCLRVQKIVTGLLQTWPCHGGASGTQAGAPVIAGMPGGQASRMTRAMTSKLHTSSQLTPRLFSVSSSLLQILFWALSLDLGTTCPSLESERPEHKDKLPDSL